MFSLPFLLVSSAKFPKQFLGFVELLFKLFDGLSVKLNFLVISCVVGICLLVVSVARVLLASWFVICFRWWDGFMLCRCLLRGCVFVLCGSVWRLFVSLRWQAIGA